MKYLKIFGLAAVAAMALMAFLGAGSASATALCTTTPTTTPGPGLGECPTGWHYPVGTVVDADLEGTAILETLGGTLLDTCTGGTVKGKTTTTGSTTETVEGDIETSTDPKNPFPGLTWEGCTKTTDTLGVGKIIIHTDPEVSNHDHNGTVTVTNTKVTVNTLFGSCVYGTGAERDIGTLTHSFSDAKKLEEHATIDINTTVIKIEGNAACPAETRWTANYTVTEPKPLYVATGLE